MPWHTYYLWSGLALLVIEFMHFLFQRKLKDPRTLLLYAMMITAFLLCAGGILITFKLNLRQANFPVTILATNIVYLCQLILPYFFFCLIHLHITPRFDRTMQLMLIPSGICVCFVLSNPYTGLIGHPEADGLWHVGSCYPYFIDLILIWYIFDLFYIIKKRKYLKKQYFPLSEIAILLIAGTFIQNILLRNLFVGFAAALSVAVIHLTLQNPYAYIDFITRVFNQNYFRYWIESRYVIHKTPSVVIIEFTELEHIHNVYSLGTDSKLLQIISEELWEITPHHQVFRLSFTRFALCTTSEKELQLMHQKLQDMFKHAFSVEDSQIFCPAKICIIPVSVPINTVSSILAYIDFLTRYTKEQTVLVGTDTLYQQFLTEQEIERFLPEAVDNDLFEIWFQPIYSVTEKKFTTLEALSRLSHPEFGFISPELFIRIAMRNDLIFKIMPLQLEKICKFMQENADKLTSIHNVKVNLSPAELTRPGYCDHLLAIIRSYHLSPELFQFEVTETAATKYTDELEDCIRNLSKSGIHLCLDDFGSGYANLNTIFRLPFTIIKMDRSLLLDICQKESARSFYRNMVTTLKNIGYKIVAEGVETEEEAGYMAAWNVDMIQGYYYAKPQSPDHLLAFLDKEESPCV